MNPDQTPAAYVALTADLMIISHPSDRERTVAELLNYVADTWDKHPVSLRDHAMAVARAHSTTREDLPPRLRTALDTMAKRGPVRELTEPAPEVVSIDALPAAPSCAQWRRSNGRADICPMPQCRRCRHLSSL